MRRVSFSGDQKTIQDVWEWYECLRKLSTGKKAKLLSDIEHNRPATDPTFVGMTPEEVDEFFRELDYVTMLDLLAAGEAAIRIDFLNRVYNRGKDSVSKRFREIYQAKGSQAALDEDILETWKELKPGTKQKVGGFNGALNLRHWLAHGRYWTPRLGRDYSPGDIYDIAYDLLVAIGLLPKS